MRVAKGTGAKTHGLRVIVGFQTCNDRLCLPPKDVELAVDIAVGTTGSTDTPVPRVRPIQGMNSRHQRPRPSLSPRRLPLHARPSRISLHHRAPVRSARTVARRGDGRAVAAHAVRVSDGADHRVVLHGSRGTRTGARRGDAGARLRRSASCSPSPPSGSRSRLAFGASGLNQFAAESVAESRRHRDVHRFRAEPVRRLRARAAVAVARRAASRADAGRGRYAGTLLMGLAFTLTSFTCTAPFLGTLLVVASQGDWQWPLAGMLVFSSVFALPFVVLALAPQAAWPRCRARARGSSSVKATMGMLELAAAMKFLSNVDLVWGWGIFTREVVLARGSSIARGAGRVSRRRSAARACAAARRGPACRAGLTVCARSRSRSGSAAASTAGGSASWKRFCRRPIWRSRRPAASCRGWSTTTTRRSRRRRARTGRVLIDFTGYTCTNCRWMEANMFPRPEVARELARYVRVRLYTDGRGELYRRFQQMEQDDVRHRRAAVLRGASRRTAADGRRSAG